MKKQKIKNLQTAEEMLDLYPQESWRDIDRSFLSPSCGDGALLKEVYARKLIYCQTETDGLKALNSMFAIDTKKSNVDHCIELLFDMFKEKFPDCTTLSQIVAHNILKTHIYFDGTHVSSEDNEEEGDKT